MYRCFLPIIIQAIWLVSIKAADPTTTLKPSTVEPTTEVLSSIITTTTSKPVNNCPHGWIYAGKLGCFHFNTDSNKNGLSWIEAQGQCEVLGGFLAEVKTEEEHEFLKTIISSYEEFIGKLQWWIGLTDVGHEGRWIWEHSEVDVSFDSWMQNKPSQKENNQDDCGLMDCGSHKCDWLDVSCYQDVTKTLNVSFICQQQYEEQLTTTTATTTSITTTPYFPGCESGWKEFENACYRFFSSTVSWGSARSSCLSYDSHLTSILTSDEQNFIESIITSTYEKTWIGGKVATFDFEWEDGSEFSYTNWYSGQPDYEGCIYLYANNYYQWSDYSCTDANYYICKKSYDI